MHRAQEADFSHSLLKKIFADPKYVTVHAPLDAYRDLGDEGAANHNILCKQYGNPGLEMFVYGRHGLMHDIHETTRFPARQTKLASSTIKRNHSLRDDRTLIVQQNPLAIDAGVFHNDVVCVTNKNVMFYHAQAFLGWSTAQLAIQQYFAGDCYFIEISPNQLSLEEAVETYIFNSQLVSLPGSNGDMALIVPMECKNSRQATELLNSIVLANNPIKLVQHVECRESMRNGGGPACLRLRAILTKQQLEACHQGIILDDKLYSQLSMWIEKYYRDTLVAEDLLDPLLSQEVFTALDELTQLLRLGSIYPFQQL
jgi:succinylarginine dihydrolase